MVPFNKHHCPTCRRVGDKRCMRLGHYVECEQHPNSYHAAITECVKCIEAAHRADVEDCKREQKKTEESGKKEKNQKKVKVKLPHQKTIKQLRREKRSARDSGVSLPVEDNCLVGGRA